MIFKEDIIRRITEDVGKNSNEVFTMLDEAIKKTSYLKTDRIIRCIIFLANGNIDDLNRYIEVATFDTRDVMLWAEYKKPNNDRNLRRLRDFNKTFEECGNNIKE